MELNEKTIEINQYINGELSGNALTKFEALLQKNKALQEKVNFHKDVDAVLLENMTPVNEFIEEEALLMPTLNDLGQKHFLENREATQTEIDLKEKPPATPKPIAVAKPTLVKRLVPMALLAAAAAMLLFVFAPFKGNFDNTELANNNFKPFSLETVMSKEDNPSIKDKARKAYSDKQYKESIPLIEKWLIDSPDSPKAWLAKGSAEYELNKLDEAIISFEQVTGNPSFNALAYWYLALAHLKKGDKQQAKAALMKIEKGEENYEKGQELLKKIDQLN